MKMAKRVLAIVMSMLLITGSVALMASASLQSDVNAGGDVPVANDTWQSIEITKDVNIDLGGHSLNGTPGAEAIVIKNGANVTIENGYVISRFAAYTDRDEDVANMIDTVVADSPAAIVVENGSLTLRNVRVMGSNTRVPYTDEAFPTGTAVRLKNGSSVTLDGASLAGRYGIDNRGGSADNVLVKEAVVLGFMHSIAGPWTKDDASEKITAADLLDADFLANGHSIYQADIDIGKQLLADRALVVSVKPDKGLVTIDRVNDYAYVTAADVVRTNANCDCSYTLVAKNAIVEENGTTKYYQLGEQLPISAVDGKDVQILYRICFDLQPDIYAKVNGGYNDIAYVYNTAVSMLDDNFPTWIAMYDNIVNNLSKLYYEIERIAAEYPEIIENVMGEDTYYDLCRDVLALGGAKVYNGAMALARENDTEGYIYYDLNKIQVEGDPNDPIDPKPAPMFVGATLPATYDPAKNFVGEDSVEYIAQYGVLDIADNFLNGFYDAMGGKDASFAFTGSNWSAITKYVLDNYNDILDAIPAAIDAIKALDEDLKDAGVADAMAEMDLGDFDPTEITGYAAYADDFMYAYNSLLQYATVANMKEAMDADTANVAHNADLAGMFLTNPQEYIDLDEYLDGDTLMGYFVYAETDVREIVEGNLHVKVTGTAGKIVGGNTMIMADVENGADYTDVYYNGTIDLAAVATDDASEFLYWKNGETKRILSTNPNFVMTTDLDMYIEAVFASKASAEAILTSNAGSITWQGSAADQVVNIPGYVTPNTPGYIESTWGYDGVAPGSQYDLAGVTATGAFYDIGTVYTLAGYEFKLTDNNKYLLTPKAGTAETHNLYFQDGEKRVGKDGVSYGKALTYTAKGSGFSYWSADAAGNEPISVMKAYKMSAVADRTAYAQYGKGAPETAYVNIVRADSDAGTLFVERSSSAAILSHGVIYSIDTDASKEDLKVEKVDQLFTFKTISTNTATSGIYTLTLDSSIGNVIAVGYVELADGSFVYSEPQVL